MWCNVKDDVITSLRFWTIKPMHVSVFNIKEAFWSKHWANLRFPGTAYKTKKSLYLNVRRNWPIIFQSAAAAKFISSDVKLEATTYLLGHLMANLGETHVIVLFMAFLESALHTSSWKAHFQLCQTWNNHMLARSLDGQPRRNKWIVDHQLLDNADHLLLLLQKKGHL